MLASPVLSVKTFAVSTYAHIRTQPAIEKDEIRPRLNVLVVKIANDVVSYDIFTIFTLHGN